MPPEDDLSQKLRTLPRVDAVLDHAAVAESGARREVARAAVAEELEARRRAIRADRPVDVSLDAVATDTVARLQRWLTPAPRRVINATGVLLHTNVGRAVLSSEAVAAMGEAAGASDLELDLVTGRRGSRFDTITPVLRALLGAEAAHVVNNNAAGLLLACTALGGTSGVALSRGQMVEIGDGFRVATMAAAGGCPVVAVVSINSAGVQSKMSQSAARMCSDSRSGRPVTSR